MAEQLPHNIQVKVGGQFVLFDDTRYRVKTNKGQPARNGNFYPLHQGGLLGIQEDISFGAGSMLRVGLLDGPPSRTDIGKVRQTLTHAKSILGIRSFEKEFPALLADPEAMQRARNNAYELIGNTYGIQKKRHGETAKERKIRIERIKEQVEDYGETANEVINRLSELLSSSPVNLRTINIVKDTFDPVDLIAISLDNKYAKRTRFEAKRKLILMDLASKIDQRDREIRIDKRYRKMNQFFDSKVFNSGDKIGEVQNIVLVSRHDPDTFATIGAVSEATPADVLEIDPPPPGIKVTPMLRRSFTYKGEQIPVQVDTRKKDAASKVLKMLRKGKESPAEAMGDEVGYMAVFRNKGDIERFKRHLNDCGLQEDTLLLINDLEDSLSGNKHKPKSAGSSPDLRQDKSHITLNGITIEAIHHTYNSYTDYLYRDEVGHDEFEAARYFDSGVVSLLFPTGPTGIYTYNEDTLKESTIHGIRNRIRYTLAA